MTHLKRRSLFLCSLDPLKKLLHHRQVLAVGRRPPLSCKLELLDLGLKRSLSSGFRV